MQLVAFRFKLECREGSDPTDESFRFEAFWPGSRDGYFANNPWLWL